MSWIGWTAVVTIVVIMVVVALEIAGVISMDAFRYLSLMICVVTLFLVIAQWVRE